MNCHLLETLAEARFSGHCKFYQMCRWGLTSTVMSAGSFVRTETVCAFRCHFNRGAAAFQVLGGSPARTVIHKLAAGRHRSERVANTYQGHSPDTCCTVVQRTNLEPLDGIKLTTNKHYECPR
jgi:hypothetical protein